MFKLLQITILCVAAACGVGGRMAHAAPPRAASPWSAKGLQLIELDCTVVNVVDGDTLDVKVLMSIRLEGRDGHGFTGEAFGEVTPLVVRLRLLADATGRGCWSPETKAQSSIEDPREREAEKKRGIASKINLEKLSLGRECTIVVPANGYALKDYMSLERVLAVAKVAGKSLGEAQIKAKHASSTKGGQLGK